MTESQSPPDDEIVIALEERLDELQRMTSRLGHEIRDSALSVSCFVTLLSRDLDARDDSRIHEDLLEIQLASGRIRALVDDLVALSRLGQVPLAVTDLDLATLVRGAACGLPWSTARETAIEIAEIPPVRGDRASLFRAFRKLFEHAALRMAAQEGGIRVIARGHGPDVQLVLEDDGPPVALGAGGGHPPLHDGIAMARRILEIQGGSLSLETPPKGLRIRISLPAARKPEAEA